MLRGKYGSRLGFDRWKIVQVIVDRLQSAGRRIAQNAVDPAFHLSGEEADSHRQCAFQVGLQFGQHGQAAGHVKSADYHRYARRAERPRYVDRTGKLIRLDADKSHEAKAAVPAEQRQELLDFDTRVDFVEDGDVDRDIGAEYAAFP